MSGSSENEMKAVGGVPMFGKEGTPTSGIWAAAIIDDLAVVLVKLNRIARMHQLEKDD